jgi:anti-sigma factor ChrR (cupin superfamily)
MDHNRASALLGAYVLDSCRPEETDEIDLHLVGCEECRDEIDRLNAVAGLIGATDLLPPPPHLRQMILDAAEASA